MKGPREEDERVEAERKRARRLTVMVDLVTSTLGQDPDMSFDEARALVEKTERAVLRMFPGTESTFHLVLRPRFDRILRERWGRGLDEVQH